MENVQKKYVLKTLDEIATEHGVHKETLSVYIEPIRPKLLALYPPGTNRKRLRLITPHQYQVICNHLNWTGHE